MLGFVRKVPVEMVERLRPVENADQ